VSVDSVTSGERRGPGRPRSTRVDESLDAAVVEILAEVGYGGLRVDDVAERAGVSKTTIYRRAPTKAALVVGVLERLKADQIPMPTTGNTADDVRALIRSLYQSLDATSFGRALAGLLAEKRNDPDLAIAIEALWQARQQLVRSVIHRGVESGDLRGDIDEADMVEILAAPAYYRLLITGQPLDPASADLHADAVWAALSGGS
jgi:AcrR family transcriptional regulator